MHKFSDFADERPLAGDKISLNEVLNIEVVIKDYHIAPSKKKTDTECLTLQLEFQGKDRVLFTGSTVLKNQILKYKDQLPFQTTIKKINNYFSFT